ncbi:hypothetical protein GCM10022381_39640 [Leifsonia kafniensis]|uniref:SHOCT domain-containing protein n=1 Tax=Leifsonia kafniensis TaxID=475957 RepID=A0ABP7L4R1_9MICO
MSTALLTTVPALLAHPGFGCGWGWGPGWFFLLFPLFWIIVLIVIFSVFGRRWRRGMRQMGPGAGYDGGYGHPYWGQASDSSSAEKTLAERFAQGDIDEVEYRARLEVLRANRPAGPGPVPPQQ